MKRIFALFCILLGIGFCEITLASSHQVESDDYIRGYVQGLFIHSYKLPVDALAVKNGFIYVHEGRIIGTLSPEQIKNKLEQATSQLKGVKGIILKKNNTAKDENYDKEAPIDGVMPNHTLFRALIADPKWPRFTLAYQYNFKNNISRQNFAPNFGASIPIYRGLMKNDIEWELGIQGGLFATFDIGKNPSALINADYYISAPFSLQRGPWSGMARIYHLSTHLGDEFMLTPQGQKIKRINLSYEGIDFLISYNLVMPFRVYGGGGYIVHKDPGYIKPLKVQIGSEYRSPNTFWEGRLRPVTGLDIKSEQMARWTPGISIKTGFQLENAALISNKIQLMLELYSGKSLSGQFYNNKVKYVGLGLHAFL